VARYSKGDSGCSAYAAGWEAKENACHACGTTTRAYHCCDIDECNALCLDLYSARVNRKYCNQGCAYMHQHGASSSCKAKAEAPTEAPTKAPTEAPTEAPTKAPTEAPEETCEDTPGFTNGAGHGCASYASRKWCSNGGAAPGLEWTLGSKYKFPEKNCVVCGKCKAKAEAPTEAPTKAPSEPPTKVPTGPPSSKCTKAYSLPPTCSPCLETIQCSDGICDPIMKKCILTRGQVCPEPVAACHPPCSTAARSGCVAGYPAQWQQPTCGRGLLDISMPDR